MARRVVFIGLAYLAAAWVALRAEERVTSGLVVLYDLEEGAGTTIPGSCKWRHGAVYLY
jgi:hypothetical protein